MSTIVTRFFRDADQAARAVTELRRNGFDDEDISVTDPRPSDEQIAASIAQARVSRRVARDYAEAMRGGAVAVSVRAVFGWAAVATEVLERAGPVTSIVADGSDFVTEDPAAPFSTSLGLPLLVNNPAPLSSLFALRVLSKRQNPNVRLAHEAAPLSRAFGLRALSAEAAPLSRALGLPLLRDNVTGRRWSFGLPLLTRRGRPFFRFLPMLSRNPAPLSRLFGLPLLSRNPAPLSTAMDAPVLTEDHTGRPPS
jgi:hypothetical protein